MAMLRKYGFWILVSLILTALLLNHIYRKPRFLQGEQAPGFELRLDDGQSFRLEDFRGRFVLLHFWGSWCGPCRQENAGLARVYREFADPGHPEQAAFVILSIGVETDSLQWARAREKDGLIWPWHYADFQRFSGDITGLYGVREVPTTYLLDPQGYIIAVNPAEEQLRRLLRERLPGN